MYIRVPAISDFNMVTFVSIRRASQLKINPSQNVHCLKLPTLTRYILARNAFAEDLLPVQKRLVLRPSLTYLKIQTFYFVAHLCVSE